VHRLATTLVCALLCLAACTTAPAPTLRVLQFNLCNSGRAGCYTGRAVAVAADVIRSASPDVVTLNEVCRSDVTTLALPGGTSAFQPARNARTGTAVRCRDGEDYGIGILTRLPATPGSSGIYAAQDTRDPEQRAWVCLDLALTVCTTHLADGDRTVAAAQCTYLFSTVVAGRRALVAGDLNLLTGSSELNSCLPPGSSHADDAGRQHVVGTGGMPLASTSTIDMRGSTDHPGLLVTASAA
jgi:endonuclease/exonuclease/phosphatase family metal-dependent hydrolase